MFTELFAPIIRQIGSNPSGFYLALACFLLFLALAALGVLLVLLGKRGRTARVLFEQLETETEKKAQLEKTVNTLRSKPTAPAVAVSAKEADSNPDSGRVNKDLVLLTREYLVREFVALSNSLAPLGCTLPEKPVLLTPSDEARIKGMLEQLEKIHSLAPEYGMIFPVEYYFSRAAFHVCRYEIEQARNILTQGLRQYPREDGFILPLARFCSILNRDNEASSVLEEFLERHPTDQEALHLLVRSRLRSGEHTKAEATCRVLNETGLRNGYRALLAWCLFREGFVSRAEEIAEELGRAESDPLTDFYLGRLDEDKGLFREALARFNRCRSSGWKDPELIRSLVTIQSLLGQQAQNRKLMEEYRLDPTLDSSALLYFIEKTGLGRDETTLYRDVCERICELRETDAVALTALSAILLKCNESVRAGEALQRALSLEPSCLPALSRLARWHLERNDHTASLEPIEKGLSLSPGDPDFLSLKSEQLKLAGDEESAFKTVRTMAEQAPHNIAVLEKIGRCYLKLQDWREALHFFFRMEEQGVKSPALYNLIGSASFGLKDYEEALKAWRRVLELDGRNLEALNNIGVIQCIRKEYRAAKKMFSRALQTDSASRQTHYNLARLYTLLNQENSTRHLARYQELSGS